MLDTFGQCAIMFLVDRGGRAHHKAPLKKGLNMNKQEVTSKETSKEQIAMGIKWVCTKLSNRGDEGCVKVLDYGSGKSTMGQRLFRTWGFKSHRFDPFNVPMEENARTIELSQARHYFNIIVCNNVLNVIKCPVVYTQVLTDLKKHSRLNHAPVYITVYEGDGKGEGRDTMKGRSYQRHLKTQAYVSGLLEHFDYVERFGRMLVCGLAR
jgi:hypothetical protein